jgi:PPOX class probable F420-dependent enzyme
MTDGQADLERLTSGSYVLITTFRRDGSEVPTPVWVVRDGEALGIWTVAASGKVKRIRNRADVLRGNPSGGPVPGRAEILDGAQTRHYRSLLGRKYGLLGRLTLLGSRLRRGVDGTVGIRITLD